MRAVAPVLLLLTSACSDPLVLDGHVTDVWGQPIQDAVVQLEGHVGNVNSDGGGAFSFEAKEGQTTFRVQAGKEGYIPGVVEMVVGEEADEVQDAVLQLYPVPERVGFYAVDKKGFAHLVAEKIQTKGTDVEAITGLPPGSPRSASGRTPATRRSPARHATPDRWSIQSTSSRRSRRPWTTTAS